MSPRSTDGWTWALGLFALGNVANGLWMLVDPAGWYANLPAAVPDFGPLNEHFVRDIGAAYVTIGAALGCAAWIATARVLAVGLAALFSGLHALGHVHDTVRGFVGPEHWWIDFPGVYLPAIVLAVLTVVLARRAPQE